MSDSDFEQAIEAASAQAAPTAAAPKATPASAQDLFMQSFEKAKEEALIQALNANPSWAVEHDGSSLTPLCRALMHKRPALARAMMELGADPSAPSGGMGWTPMALAVDDPSMVRLLLSKGVSPDSKTLANVYPLTGACARDNWESVQALVEAGATIEPADATASPALMAAGSTDDRLLPYLISKGAEPFKPSSPGSWTALHQAAKHGRTASINLLISLKAAVNVADREGLTPLHWAAESKDIAAVKALLAAGAKANLEDSFGKIASERANDPTLKALLIEAAGDERVPLAKKPKAKAAKPVDGEDGPPAKTTKKPVAKKATAKKAAAKKPAAKKTPEAKSAPAANKASAKAPAKKTATKNKPAVSKLVQSAAKKASAKPAAKPAAKAAAKVAVKSAAKPATKKPAIKKGR